MYFCHSTKHRRLFIHNAHFLRKSIKKVPVPFQGRLNISVNFIPMVSAKVGRILKIHANFISPFKTASED